MNEVLRMIKSRRSVRSYRAEQISKEELTTVIEAGIDAPSAANNQPWYFTVIQNKDMLDHINQKAKIQMAKADSPWILERGQDPGFHLTYHAPALIIVSRKKDAMAGETGCGMAMQNMMLAAQSLGIGSVCLGLLKFYFGLPEEVEKLSIPEGYEPIYGIALGYKADETPLPATHRNYDVVNYLV